MYDSTVYTSEAMLNFGTKECNVQNEKAVKSKEARRNVTNK
jgi:hypothetical protein